jgi:pimeloyl-ACP methyl ester carboxylesterase
MAGDVAAFISQQGLKPVTLVGHSMYDHVPVSPQKTSNSPDHGNRGAKTAMTLALQSPDLVESLVAVDNAPVDAALTSDFAKYIQGMQKIQAANVTRQVEADEILRNYEEVCTAAGHFRDIQRPLTLHRPFLLDSSCLGTFGERRARKYSNSGSL